MKKYGVTLPIGGHVWLEVEAESEKEAIEKALEMEVSDTDIYAWETLRKVNQGNICYFPSPWWAEAEEIEE